MNNQPPLDKLIKITNEILRAKYPTAEFAFLAGSIVRGEGTAFSDLDIVVIYRDLPNAFRESFYFGGFPVETFVHTPETLNYFMHDDWASGFPIMPNMICEGIVVPAAGELSEKLKKLAENYLAKTPPLTNEQLDALRYQITNLIDDVRAPGAKEYLTATGAELYEVLADFYFRAGNFQSAKNKSIPRRLEIINPILRGKFCDAFEELFAAGKTEKVVRLAEELLALHGGFLFDGYRLDAAPDCGKPLE